MLPPPKKVKTKKKLTHLLYIMEIRFQKKNPLYELFITHIYF